MKQWTCDAIDDYLLDQLDAAEQIAFQEHLASCEACRQQIQIQHVIDQECFSRQDPVSCPDRLRLQVGDQIRRQQTRLVAFRLVGGATAAGLLFLFAGWSLGWFSAGSQPQLEAQRARPETSQSSSQKADATQRHVAGRGSGEDRPAVTVSLPDDQSLLALRIENSDPSMTVFLMYPTIPKRASSDRDFNKSFLP